ncbi:putative: dual specificity protein phosphatase CDC14A-like isoform X3 [Tritrichomonas foetus]|uniref:protein-tyrosine-phosphatase n=1 Tax=Tritrichomonas foetus TaxID=1144522 RepID=A0A1J4JBB3_9EUKA|nr:putative: dual specificity protein phosphatase CDC14A-like isoform X3 [Tritrichomonas foetus]|eukprot:OHS94947.1 putative: dual specificity protein phosphatase CDC14A-like isoform X3 [Tritrichomonas foetus]
MERKHATKNLSRYSIDIIPDKFVFSIHRLQNSDSMFSFSIDHDENFQYQPFYEDFGPLSLLHIHLFGILCLNHLQTHLEKKLINFYCGSNPQRISNAVLLASSFRMIHLKMSANDSVRPFIKLLNSSSKPYRDASSYPSTYDLSVVSCLKGLERAIYYGWYNFLTFDVNQWSKNETIENGDMNWLIPGKLLAFASPYSTNNVQGFFVCTPKEIVPTFKEMGITRIIRLNNKTYDENIFIENGFAHTELFFPDGTNPPQEILQRFFEIIESEDVTALHCKAGLGRTYEFFLFFLKMHFMVHCLSIMFCNKFEND